MGTVIEKIFNFLKISPNYLVLYSALFSFSAFHFLNMFFLSTFNLITGKGMMPSIPRVPLI